MVIPEGYFDYVVLGACGFAFLSFLFVIITLICVSKVNKKVKKFLKGQTAPTIQAPVVQPKEEVAVAVSADDAVSFSADKGLTLDDKYSALDKATKKRYDEIANYASKVEGGKRFKNLRYEEYKVGSLRIVRMLIKRGIIVCEFMMQNQSFKSYVMENKISAKQSATVIKVSDDDSVQVIKDTIDIVVKQIEAEKELKKQIAREKRRAKRQESK